MPSPNPPVTSRTHAHPNFGATESREDHVLAEEFTTTKYTDNNGVNVGSCQHMPQDGGGFKLRIGRDDPRLVVEVVDNF